MHLDINEALRYGTCGIPLTEISADVLEAVADIIVPWGTDAGSRLAGMHPSDRTQLTDAVRGVLWRALNDHALFLREHAGQA